VWNKGVKTESVFAAKYNPVALKTKPVYGELPEKYRIKRQIIGDPLTGMPGLIPNPVDYSPMGRYTTESMNLLMPRTDPSFSE
jgi:hypothetical protein